MKHTARVGIFMLGSVALLALATACSRQPSGSAEEGAATAQAEGQQAAAAQDRNPEETQGIVLLRGLPTLGTRHSVAIVELDPEAPNFGEILQDFEFTGYDAPLHHLYYSPSGRLYSTGLDPRCSLAEIGLSESGIWEPR